ncbi:FdhF/YdeP family oxidoreductase [Thioclava sp. 'Guangxiensis']|uniref:FdhF/YdeP family oxidoreductase n=1 Tax=Thioclava sp. 'Guangxiensis' TaxID=3149044 RepID=UPI003877BD53
MPMKPEDYSHSPVEADAGTPVYKRPAGGWGSLEGVARIMKKEPPTPLALQILAKLNKTGGAMCSSCAWAKPANPGTFEFCENGAKATLWELTTKKVGPAFFATHKVSDLRQWTDHDLEAAGRLTHPMRYDATTDSYQPVAWEEAFAEIGRELNGITPDEAVFYASGHAGLEPSYLYALLARIYGTNNLPQSSNMCHETTSVNLNTYLGVPVGTCTLEDFDHCDALFFFGQNTGTNSPRLLHTLKEAVDRGCKVVTFNPIREKGLLEFTDPQSPKQMVTGKSTKISDHYYQVRPGGDIAVLAGMIKYVLAREDAAPGTVLDHDFIAEHTQGLEEAMAEIRTMDWAEIEHHSGLTRAMIEQAAEIYVDAKRVIGVYGMGLTQHVNGWLNLGMLVNLLLLRGNMGRLGAGISPVRGHSNVQGQRTVGIGENPALFPLDKQEKMFGVTLPRTRGMNIVKAGKGVIEGRVKATIALGGNLLRAMPDIERLEEAWGKQNLTVSIAIKLNRSHLNPGKVSYILPCLGRTDEDLQNGVPQVQTVEDTMSHIFASLGRAKPPSDQLKSELAIIAGIAKATLPANPALQWDDWTANYDHVRDLIAATWPAQFHEMNLRMSKAGGFYRGNAARERRWNNEAGKALFTTPTTLSALGQEPGTTARGQSYTLNTMRSNDQFNTTIYGHSDRLRGLSGSRMVVLINRGEMERAGLSEGQKVTLVCDIEDGRERRVEGLSVTAFDLPDGCVAGYYPELNPLIPLEYHELRSGTPAYKGTPVRIIA